MVIFSLITFCFSENGKRIKSLFDYLCKLNQMQNNFLKSKNCFDKYDNKLNSSSEDSKLVDKCMLN